jgi:hypothetical protein
MITFENHQFDLIYNDISGWNVCPNIPNYKGEWTAGQSASNTTFELLQFTGIKDKNGKEIFEGDILKIFNCKMVEQVLFEESAFGFYKHTTINRHTGSFEVLGDYTGSSGYEIVGNVYENPELLK